jgi:hypothetical protein
VALALWDQLVQQVQLDLLVLPVQLVALAQEALLVKLVLQDK